MFEFILVSNYDCVANPIFVKLIIINLKNSLPKLTIKTNLTLTKMLIQDLVSEQLKVTIGKDHLMQVQQGLIYQKYLIRLKTNLEFPF